MSNDNKDLFDGLMDGLQEGIDHVKGKDTGATHRRIVKKTFRSVKVFSKDDIKAIRDSLFFTQPVFADLLGVDVDTLRSWEQGRVQVSGPNARLLELISEDKDHHIIKEFELKEA
jgi:putative transcriptional regulator